MVKLREITTIQTGVFLKESVEPNALYLQLSDFDADGVLHSNVSASVFVGDKMKKHLLKDGDLLLAAKGSNNVCIIMPDIAEQCVASPSFLIIRINNRIKVLPAYLCWFLNLSATQQMMASRAALGTSIMSISKSALGELTVPLPSVEKQRQYIELSTLQRRERQLYEAIAEKRRKVMEYKMIKNI